MKKSKSESPGLKSRQIVGFSLPPSLAAEVKAEASRRKIKLRELFAEIWDIYKSRKPAR